MFNFEPTSLTTPFTTVFNVAALISSTAAIFFTFNVVFDVINGCFVFILAVKVLKLLSKLFNCDVVTSQPDKIFNSFALAVTPDKLFATFAISAVPDKSAINVPGVTVKEPEEVVVAVVVPIINRSVSSLNPINALSPVVPRSIIIPVSFGLVAVKPSFNPIKLFVICKFSTSNCEYWPVVTIFSTVSVFAIFTEQSNTALFVAVNTGLCFGAKILEISTPSN